MTDIDYSTVYEHVLSPELLDIAVRNPRTHLAPIDEALGFSTLVGRWSQVSFDRPVPFIDRRAVKVGDTVFSSHGRVLTVTRVHATEEHGTTVGFGGPPALVPTVQFWFEGTTHTERYEGSIPLLARDGIEYGRVAR